MNREYNKRDAPMASSIRSQQRINLQFTSTIFDMASFVLCLLELTVHIIVMRKKNEVRLKEG